MFGTLVILYLFLGGCSGGLLFLSSTGSLMFHRREERTQEATFSFEAMKKYGFLIGVLLLILASACLVADLGRPDRIMLLFTRPTWSLLTFGSFIIVAVMISGALLILANFFSITLLGSSAKKILEVICAIGSLLLIVYTGVYLQGVKAVALWDTLAIPTLFVVSSLSSGIALLSLIGSFAPDCGYGDSRILLSRWHVVVAVAEGLVLCWFITAAATDVFGAESLVVIFSPELRWWFFIGAVGAGIVIPLVSGVVSVLSHKMIASFPVDIACLFGAFCLRYCIVSAGLH